MTWECSAVYGILYFTGIFGSKYNDVCFLGLRGRPKELEKIMRVTDEFLQLQAERNRLQESNEILSERYRYSVIVHKIQDLCFVSRLFQ